MYDQGLVTLGPGDSLAFPNDVVRLLVEETILENNGVRVLRLLTQVWWLIRTCGSNEPVQMVGRRIQGLLAPSAVP